jgi:hypothetical protein
MTRNRARGVCRMKNLRNDIRYTYDLLEAMRENRCNEIVRVSLQEAA